MIKAFPHYGHCSKLLVVEGQVVEKGQIIARVGTTGNSTAPHCHFELPKKIVSFNQYPIGKGKQFVLDNYVNPYVYLSQAGVIPPMAWTHTGNNWLTAIGGNTFHPGVDFNRAPQDLNDPLYAVVKSRVLYAQYNAGWGYHIFLEPILSALLDADIQAMFKRVWKVAPATGDWMYFKRRLEQGTIHDEADMEVKMDHWKWKVYPNGFYSVEGNEAWQQEKRKVLGQKNNL